MANFLFVHGAFHGAWCWDQVVRDLAAAGHEARAVDLLLTSLDDDAAVVRKAIESWQRPVIVVGHSYGGHVISRATAGQPNVIHLVYVAAVMLDADDVPVQRAKDFSPSSLPEHLAIDGDMASVGVKGAEFCFYNECDDSVAGQAARRLRPTALACLAVPANAEPWASIPSTYVLSERDRAIDPSFQRWMSQRARRVVALDVDHSPFLSAPAQLVNILDEVGVDAARVVRASLDS